jgi:2-amino-4-hydroxy-6-hydroxymethyldihydropteridine diphosphokinase
MNDRPSFGTALLGLGANIPGNWGDPRTSLSQAAAQLEAHGLSLLAASRIYLTKPVGPRRQPPYVNAVVVVRCRMAPGALLRFLKWLERQAGRRLGPRWSPRSLDLDILDYGGRRLGWPAHRRQPGRLILPHPEMHKRAFVLVPLLEVVPAWRHPVLRVSGRALLAKQGVRKDEIRSGLDFIT